MESRPDDLQLNRHLLYERFAVSQVAMSSDGLNVTFAGPVETGVRVGGFAVAELDDDLALVMQVQDVDLIEHEGPELDLDIPAAMRAPGVLHARARPRMRALRGHAVTLGVLHSETFTRTLNVEPFGERPFRPAGPEELAMVAAGLADGATTFDIGVYSQDRTVPARLRPTGFGRHTFMCGQSGSGKTYTTGALLERLLASTTLPIVVIDPNSDHVFLGATEDPADDSPRAVRHREVGRGVHVARARGFDSPVLLCLDFSDIDIDMQALLLHMHPVRDLDDYQALRRVTAELTAPYSVADVAAAAARSPHTERLATRIDNLRLADWDLWRRAGERSAADYDLHAARCLVIDVGSLPTPDERTVVALTMLGIRWAQRRRREPVLMVVDEAHNVLPAATDNPLLQATTDLGILVAGEGRKYGLHLFVATQRPDKVHPNVVSQCDNLILMRMNSTADIESLGRFFSHVPDQMLRQATGFGLGQALFAGPVAPVPLFAQVGTRVSPQGGGDVPTTWAHAVT